MDSSFRVKELRCWSFFATSAPTILSWLVLSHNSPLPSERLQLKSPSEQETGEHGLLCKATLYFFISQAAPFTCMCASFRSTLAAERQHRTVAWAIRLFFQVTSSLEADSFQHWLNTSTVSEPGLYILSNFLGCKMTAHIFKLLNLLLQSKFMEKY